MPRSTARSLPRAPLLAAVLLAVVAATADAQTRTSFDPSAHGFHFANTFSNDVVSDLDVRTGGLCGGMVYAALDYYHHAGRSIPDQDFRPANRTTLQSYLYARQVRSIEPNATKWAEIGFNPGGARNDEFFRWGLTSELRNLERFLDRGRPVPLGLQGVHEGIKHQVLAIGYRDPGPPEDLRILLYDPNFPDETITMRPDMEGRFFDYEGKRDPDDPHRFHWRTYFVDHSYAPETPPEVPGLDHPDDGRIRELVVHVDTGDDDLRGGNDNVNLVLHLADGSRIVRNRINRGARWLSNYTESARVRLPRPVPRARIRAVELTTTFGGGVGGDNWDVKRVRVDWVKANGAERLAERTAFFRFTGDRRSLRLDVPRVMPGVAAVAAGGVRAAAAAGLNVAGPPAPAPITHLELGMRTGSDDLRGGNDNVDATILYRDGRRQRVRTLNARQRWEDGSSHVVRLRLERPVPRDGIVGLTLSTTFGGGIGGDNWNLDYLRVTPFAGGTNRGDYVKEEARPLKRFTGDDRTYTVRW